MSYATPVMQQFSPMCSPSCPVTSCNPVSDWLLSAHLLHQDGKMTVTADQAKDTFYAQLQDPIQAAPPHNIVVILTDANTTISSQDPALSAVPCPVFIDIPSNDNSQRLSNLCRATNLYIDWYNRHKTGSITGPGTGPKT